MGKTRRSRGRERVREIKGDKNVLEPVLGKHEMRRNAAADSEEVVCVKPHCAPCNQIKEEKGPTRHHTHELRTHHTVTASITGSVWVCSPLFGFAFARLLVLALFSVFSQVD